MEYRRIYVLMLLVSSVALVSCCCADRPAGRALLQEAVPAKPANGMPAKPGASAATAGGLPAEQQPSTTVTLNPAKAANPPRRQRAVAATGPKLDLAIEALNVTGVSTLLTNETVATIFAPSDAAFTSLAKKLNLAGGGPALLSNALAYNFTLLSIIPGKALRSTDLPVNQVVTASSLLGPNLEIERTAGRIRVHLEGSNNTAEVVKADVPFNKMVVHVINKVLV